MVAWPTVCRPVELGGLGVTDLRLAGYVLQTRWLWLQRTDTTSQHQINDESQSVKVQYY